MGLYEVLVPDDHVRHLIATRASIMEINRAVQGAGNNLLIDDAKNKVSLGLTTIEEVLRVLGQQ